MQLERSAPTPTNEAFTTVMQTMASNKWEGWSSDISNAFGQAMKTNRRQPLAASLPPGLAAAGFDCDSRCLLLCKTEVYGLISGPSWLRQSLVACFEELGYVRNPYDRCILTLAPPDVGRNKNIHNVGVVLIEVDDVLEGGNAAHRKQMESFYAKFKCGKKINLFELGKTGTRISGIRVCQNKDYTFEWHMNEYVDNEMSVIDIPRGFKTHTKELSDDYMSQVMSSNGKIGWIGGNGRPDLAAGHSIIAGQYKDKSPQLITDCNQCVQQARDHRIVIKVWSIPLKDIRFVGFCDSSFDFSGVRHQQGWIVGFTNRHLNENRRAPVSIALWKSRKLARKASSPQAVETYAGSGCCADLNWVRCMLLSTLYANWDILLANPRHYPKVNRTPSVLKTDRPTVIDPQVTLCSDSKGLFDALNNELPQDDKKSAIETPIIDQMLASMVGRARWIPHNVNPADGLTKLKGAHLRPLLDLLNDGCYHLITEEAQLKQRKEEKENLGQARRLKDSGKHSPATCMSVVIFSAFLSVGWKSPTDDCSSTPQTYVSSM